MITKSKTLSVSIDCSPAQVYEFIFNAENLPKWAKGLGTSVGQKNGEWMAMTPQGEVKIRFAEVNELGVLDHWVTISTGQVFLNPMRVVPNGSGSEVTFTLFQLPEMSDAMFAHDMGLVEGDLRKLKEILEAGFPLKS